MAQRYLHKVSALTEIKNLSGAAGMGYYAGRQYVNGGYGVQPVAFDFSFGEKYFIDADNGSDSNSGYAGAPLATIAAGLLKMAAGDWLFIRPRAASAGASDPVDYAEALTVPAGKSNLHIVGFGSGPAQGAQPHIKKGSGTAALLTVRSPGCEIVGLSWNGSGATGGGILLDDDASTKSAFGTIIANCFFKNCKGSAAAGTGGAVQWSSAGGAWQVRIVGNRFFNNRGGIVLIGTSGSRPTDVQIEDCVFGSDVNTAIDCDIYLAGGSGAQGVGIRRCSFETVDVPAYATSPTAARYLDLTGCEGILADCDFACLTDGTSAKTFKADGDAAKIPTTVRIVRCYGECVSDGILGGAIERAA